MIKKLNNLSTKIIYLVNKHKIPRFPKQPLSKQHFREFWINVSRRRCYFCDELVAHSPYLCDGCTEDLPMNECHCSRCAMPLNTHYADSICAECLTLERAYKLIKAPFVYRFPVNAAIKQIKYAKQSYYLRALAPYLINQLADKKNEVDLVIPVPIHGKKRRMRGENHVESLAALISRALDIPMDHRALKKTAFTPAQVSLNRKERIANLKGSFQCRGSVAGKRIALVDDVVTTGATCELLSQLLKQHGARSVEVWCLARTPKPS